MSVISFAAPKKKTLSQVYIYWMIFMNDFGHTVEPQSYEPRSYKLTGYEWSRRERTAKWSSVNYDHNVMRYKNFRDTNTFILQCS